MRVALFSDQKKFDDIKSYSDVSNAHLRISHTQDIKKFFTLLFCEKTIPYDYVIIEEQLAGTDFDDVLQCASAHLSRNKIAVLSPVFSHKNDFFTFDVNELSLKRLVDYVKITGSKVPPLQSEHNNVMETLDDFERMLRRYETIINGAGEAIVGLNENGQITFLNVTACELLGDHKVDLLGKSLTEFALDSPMNKGVNMRSFTGNYHDKRRVGRGVISKPDGNMIYVEYTQSYVGNQEDDTVSIMVIEDISDRVKFEAKLKTLVNSDPLTGLANRRYLKRALENELSENRQHTSPLITALIDLDEFKQVNDQYGHSVGDKLLALTANRLKDHLRRGDLVARLGGDEFVIMFKETSLDDATSVIENLLCCIRIPFIFQENTIKPSVSIGLCMARPEDNKLDDLLQRMDKALYKVKRSGKDDFAWYVEESNRVTFNKFVENT